MILSACAAAPSAFAASDVHAAPSSSFFTCAILKSASLFRLAPTFAPPPIVTAKVWMALRAAMVAASVAADAKPSSRSSARLSAILCAVEGAEDANPGN